MDLLEQRYIIGIDLGTTNSAVAYVDLQIDPNHKPRIQLFKVPQLTGPGEFARLPVLPSFLYIPGTYDISKEVITVPWKSGNQNFVGAFARDHGAEVPARLVSSAKSWLCHSNVDRKARILPWGAGDEVLKVSPVQATAAYLEHIKRAWNHTKGDEEELYLENQMIIVTVPASFDEVARELTSEAAALAGLTHVTLLEEPLAAFYSWLMQHENNWNQFVSPNELILVCDVGGGTTDFTLITLREIDGNPRFERIAVGDHLLLGGDNIDLALARRVEMRFNKAKSSLSGDRWKALCHQCRQAKEILLEGKAQSQKITLMGTGSKLIAGTLTTELQRSEVEETVIKGFFPHVDAAAAMEKNIRKGITEFGLPYEPEPSITRHLGWFLDRHKADVKKILNRDCHAPDLILFNGGSLIPPIIQERIRSAIRYWFKEKDNSLPRVLENPTPHLTVALGASYYGLVKIGKGVRVGSGSARAYYLGIEKATEEKLKKEKNFAICLVERGLEEGSHIELKDKSFEVLANQPVSFDIYSSSFRSGDRCGDLVQIDDSLTILPPMQTIVQFGKKGRKTKVPVRIEASYTEMGTLSLWCHSLVSNHRWQLQFQLRDRSPMAEISDKEVFDESMVENVRSTVRNAFSDQSDGNALEAIVKEIGNIIERPRDKWPLGLIRSISDVLLNLEKVRKLSPNHESRWLNLTGFCLRPGFGDGFDTHRIKALWKIQRQGPIHLKNPQVCSEWWILWRRAGGGLTSGQQRQFSQELSAVLDPKKGIKSRIAPQERLEIWMTIANMERLMVKDKMNWGRLLLSEIRPKKCRPQHFWALSRLGARELLYGPIDKVIPAQEVSSWIDTILAQNWRNPKPVGAAIAQMARKTGDRARDLSPESINHIISWMSQYEFCEQYLKFLKSVIPIAKQEENALFGESLPSGIVLHSSPSERDGRSAEV
ncbi:MAG: hsp70 family protein [Desulfobacterales bacterium]|nr:hsp70 family protein [Desulfobacterales bacterium]